MTLLLLLYSAHIEDIYQEMFHDPNAPDYRKVRAVIVSHTGQLPLNYDAPYRKASMTDLRTYEIPSLADDDRILLMPECGDPYLAAKVGLLASVLGKSPIIIDRNWQLV